jgi:hypothetical protein
MNSDILAHLWSALLELKVSTMTVERHFPWALAHVNIVVSVFNFTGATIGRFNKINNIGSR